MNNSCPNRIARRCFLQDTGKVCLSIGLPSLFLTPGEADASASTSSGFEPAYLRLHESGELEKRADEKWGREEAYESYKRRTPVLVLRPPRAG